MSADVLLFAAPAAPPCPQKMLCAGWYHGYGGSELMFWERHGSRCLLGDVVFHRAQSGARQEEVTLRKEQLGSRTADAEQDGQTVPV